MAKTFESYRTPGDKLPDKMLTWHLYGAGLENLGKDGNPEEVPVPACGPRELLLRVDAASLCFSDTKVIKAGPDHPRLIGRNLKEDPTVLGHEVAGTVVRVGEEIQDRFKVGQRYVVQADCYYKGLTMAFGYVFKGGLSQYTIIPHQMIDGDEGTYLLPIAETTGYSEGALAEPWACVIAAFNISFRKSGKPGGVACVIAAPGAKTVDFQGVFSEGAPARVFLVQASSFEKSLRDAAPKAEILLQDNLPEVAVDDLFIVGPVDKDRVTQALQKLADHGVACLVQVGDAPMTVSLDVGRVHYDHLSVIGTETGRVADAYQTPIRTTLLPKGKAWFVGAGGPMGRMHVQNALELSQGPSVVVATEVSQERLDDLVCSYGPLARERGVELVGLNPMALGPQAFAEKLREIAPSGFDDIINLAPIPKIIEATVPFAGAQAVLNIFAGLSRGTTIQIDLKLFARTHGIRAMGSSGSRIDDMSTILRRAESDQMDTDRSVAAISGMMGVWKGLKAVFENTYPGKIVIYPQVQDIGLTALNDLSTVDAAVAAQLKDGQRWCADAEKELLVRHAK